MADSVAEARPFSDQLLGRLQAIEGLAFRAYEPLARYTTFRIGGPAQLLAEVTTVSALAQLRRLLADEVPFQLLGLGSNVLVPDEGIAGVVARLGGEFDRVEVEGDRVRVGGGVTLAHLARRMAARDLVGLEALSGFPSTVGGAVVMNAGCYGREIKDLLLETTVIGQSGERRILDLADLRPVYRGTSLQGSSAVVVEALFQLHRGDGAEALARARDLNRKRWASLPSGVPHAGSVFKNPPADHAGRLIEACGLKGRCRGGAQISIQHANVIVNREHALAADVLGLMSLAWHEVRQQFDIALAPELVLLGSLAQCWQALMIGDRDL